jgi:hypothetical protein
MSFNVRSAVAEPPRLHRMRSMPAGRGANHRRDQESQPKRKPFSRGNDGNNRKGMSIKPEG